MNTENIVRCVPSLERPVGVPNQEERIMPGK